jgi:GNAT superfamily N-acetyltransferase
MGSDRDRSGLLDDLAGRILAASPHRFDLAVNPENRSTAYRIRAVASAAAGWARPGDFPDGMERDEFDDVAVHVVGWDGAEAVCTGRLVFPPSPLPTEVACGLAVEPRGLVVDVGRMAVLPSHQTFGHGTFLALLCQLYREARAAGFDVACGMMAAPARALVSRLGLRLEQLGPERGHHGQERAPVRFVLAANVEPLAERWEDRGQGGGPSTRQAFTPPNPKEFDSP